MATKKTILIVDDEPWYVQPLKDKLESAGYQVRMADTGGAAIRLLESKEIRVDLAIVDIMMDPGDMQGGHEDGRRTGVLLCEYVRNTMKKDAKSLPLICLTVVNASEVRSRARELDVQFFSKADTAMAEILDRVNALLPCPS